MITKIKEIIMNIIWDIEMIITRFTSPIIWAYQRVVRGYDDRIFWGFDDYIKSTIVPALKKYCENELKDLSYDYYKNHKNMFDVYKETLRLVKVWESDEKDPCPCKISESERSFHTLMNYFVEHIEYYWD